MSLLVKNVYKYYFLYENINSVLLDKMVINTAYYCR